jgi:hypothetical protein
MIPLNATVSCMPEIFPQIANRINAYPYLTKNSSYILIDTINEFWLTTKYAAPATNLPWLIELSKLDYNNYGVLAQKDGILLLQRDYRDNPKIISLDNYLIYPTSFTRYKSKLIYDNSSPMMSYLDVKEVNGITLEWSGPYKVLLPGTYRIGVWLLPTDQINNTLELIASIGTDEIKDLKKWDIKSESLHNSWNQVWLSVDIPYPGYFELKGYSLDKNDIQFGGIIVEQISIISIK